MEKDFSKKKKISKKYFMSFLPHYCHSFRITVIPSRLLSFLPDYCHSFRISVIHSKLFRELQILTSFKSFPYPKGEKNSHQRWPYMRVILNWDCKAEQKDSDPIFCTRYTCLLIMVICIVKL